MSLTTEGMGAADLAAVLGENRDSWGGGSAW